MSYPLSRFMSAATAAYGVYALAQPRHLGRAVTNNGLGQSDFDLLARTYGVRDLPVSLLGMLGRSEGAVRSAMTMRVAFDVADGLLLSTQAKDASARKTVLGATLGWATLNTLALLIDRRRAGRAVRL